MRTKRPISWHEECVSNARLSLAVEERRLAFAQERVNKLRTYIDFYNRQIAEAQKRGLSEFDSDRLLVSKEKSTVAE